MILSFRNNMMFSTAIAYVLILVPTSNGQIDCYECTVHPPETYTNKLSKLCTKFNTSDYFKVHCPNSTYCKKKSFQLEVQPGKIIKGAVRGCGSVPQKYDYHVIRNGSWRLEPIMEVSEPKNGCYSGNDNELRTSDTTFCYCDENLCNNAKHTTNFSSHTDTIAVIIIYNIMRFLKTHTQPA
ncbi:uncharacterized protein LOC112680482 isoform X2 [Sipha flava]|uniref:Uncharacterized protein LOC112680482 isoform X2 n=1 Tax=Sipha flava TaxID=143950 RepID=A0A2S2R8G4_9HEMI|nr:uncharacterized protein LOC112680482 isoform X2 [Sipha flava]